ncbi:T9SS type A sorting domain-containing protein [Halocola ammonii]
MNLSRLPFVILSFFLCSSVLAQQDQNLVPNGHFEDYYMCPDDISQIDRLAHWTSWRVTPDYFNSCDSTSFVGVPLSSAMGYQNARSGEGYIGMTAITQNNLREIAGVELNTALTLGQDYYFEMFVSRTFGGLYNTNCNCSVNKMGAQFFTQSFDFMENPVPVNNSAQIVEESIISDSTSWVKISGWFTADDNYTHLGIGNFFDFENCSLDYHDSESGVSFNSYYFIEDVCVATDPAICDLWNKVSEPENESLQIERIGSDQIRLRGLSESSQLTIFDQSGRVLETRTVLPEELINTNHLAAGIYILSVESGESLVTGRFVKY